MKRIPGKRYIYEHECHIAEAIWDYPQELAVAVKVCPYCKETVSLTYIMEETVKDEDWNFLTRKK